MRTYIPQYVAGAAGSGSTSTQEEALLTAIQMRFLSEG
jgi:hypothetical protein